MESLYKTYDDPKRKVYGFMPFFGPLFTLGRYIGFRWNNRAEIKEGRQKLGKLVREIQDEFGLRKPMYDPHSREKNVSDERETYEESEPEESRSDSERSREDPRSIRNELQKKYDKSLNTLKKEYEKKYRGKIEALQNQYEKRFQEEIQNIIDQIEKNGGLEQKVTNEPSEEKGNSLKDYTFKPDDYVGKPTNRELLENYSQKDSEREQETRSGDVEYDASRNRVNNEPSLEYEDSEKQDEVVPEQITRQPFDYLFNDSRLNQANLSKEPSKPKVRLRDRADDLVRKLVDPKHLPAKRTTPRPKSKLRKRVESLASRFGKKKS